jgi:hypothetical protein
MKKRAGYSCLLAFLIMAFSPVLVCGASAPVLSSLGQIKEGLSAPASVALDAAGQLYVADTRRRAVLKFDRYGVLLSTFARPHLTGGMTVSADGSRLYVAEGAKVVWLNALTGVEVGQLGIGEGEFLRAYDIEVDDQGNVYVADSQAQLIKVYDSQGGGLFQFGGPGEADHHFGIIADLTMHVAAGEIYVADVFSKGTTVKPKIKVFDLSGQLRRTLSADMVFGSTPLSFFGAMAFDPMGRGYFLDTLRNDIRILSLPSTYLSSYTPFGYLPGELSAPSDVAFDPETSRLFVLCSGARIEILGIDGGQNPVRTNIRPSLPIPLSPGNDSVVGTTTPELLFKNSTDADGDLLTYEVQVYAGDSLLAQYAGHPVVEGRSSALTSQSLAENQRFQWTVRAFDGEDASEWTLFQSFWINAVEEAPTAPVVVAPLAMATADKDTIFSWQAATDADPLATVTYRLEIASSADFTAPVITVEQDELSSAALATLPGYADLQPSASYHWRVVAVDNSGLTTPSEVRSFDYVSTVLRVDATFPGARVYLGGNGAYSGRYVGEVPVELRDINPGTLEVVVERAGFEPWVKRVVVNARQSVAVQADLVVAILPGEFKKAALLAGGLKIQGGAEAAPVLVDFDSDGFDDLLVADGSGKLLLYKGVAGAEWPVLSGVQLAGVTLPVGAVPFVADWNNDDRKDLLVGAADGSVSLYLNDGTQAAPLFAAAITLQADNAPLNVGSNATPLLFDLNSDGAKDLLVGSGNGTLYKFLNSGNDEDPVLAAGEVLIAATAGAVNASALVTDWDADGSKEILLAANQEIVLYERQDDGSYARGAPLLVHQSLYSTKTRTYEMQCSSFGQKIRVIAANTDEAHGKDLLIGNAAGEILLAYSTMNKSRAISPLFDAALLATVGEIEAMIQAHALSTSQVTETLNQLKTNISSQAVNKLKNYDKAKQDLASLQSALQTDEGILTVLGQLQVQLSSTIPLN